MNLWSLKPNTVALIEDTINSETGVSAKIEDLGAQKNETIECVQWVPFGGPRLYRLQNGIFAIEESVARSIKIRVGGE